MEKIVRIDIGEPWDFEVSGSNLIYGKIIGVCFGPEVKDWKGKYLLIKLQKSFEWEGETVKELVAAEREVGTSVDDILAGKLVFCNIARVKPGATIDVGKHFKPEDVEYEFMGTIELKSKLG